MDIKQHYGMELFMKIIDTSLLDQISGGRGNNGGDRSDNGGRRSRNNGHNGGGAPKTCANDVGVGIITGALTGMAGGPWTMIGFAVAGAATASLGCPDKSPYRNNNNNNRDALAGNRSPNSVNGQCRW